MISPVTELILPSRVNVTLSVTFLATSSPFSLTDVIVRFTWRVVSICLMRSSVHFGPSGLLGSIGSPGFGLFGSFGFSGSTGLIGSTCGLTVTTKL